MHVHFLVLHLGANQCQSIRHRSSNADYVTLRAASGETRCRKHMICPFFNTARLTGLSPGPLTVLNAR